MAKEAESRTVKVVSIAVGHEPETVESDCSLESLQGFVGGFIEPFDVLFGDSPCLFVNEEGLYNGSEPIRAVYATDEMAAAGYLSQADFRRVVEPGELYAVLFGDIVGVSYGTDPETGDRVPRDITQEEFYRVCRELGEPGTGWFGVMEILSGTRSGSSEPSTGMAS